jgi:hypothetical protein
MIDLDIREHWKLIAIIIAGAALLALIITIFVGLAARGRTREDLERQAAIEEQAVLPLTVIDELELRPEKLMLGPGIEEFWYGDYQPRYPQRRQWGMDDLRRYWYDPRQIGSESLRSVNEELIDEILRHYR